MVSIPARRCSPKLAFVWSLDIHWNRQHDALKFQNYFQIKKNELPLCRPVKVTRSKRNSSIRLISLQVKQKQWMECATCCIWMKQKRWYVAGMTGMLPEMNLCVRPLAADVWPLFCRPSRGASLGLLSAAIDENVPGTKPATRSTTTRPVMNGLGVH